jgi:hypothetical protein
MDNDTDEEKLMRCYIAREVYPIPDQEAGSGRSLWVLAPER